MWFDCKEWYRKHLDQSQPDVMDVAESLRQILFRKMTKPDRFDYWQPGKTGVFQPGGIDSSNNDKNGVVSAEFAAFQVMTVIEQRWRWLDLQNLPKNTKMDDEQRQSFLKWAKREFHEDAAQRLFQHRDKNTKGSKGLHAGKRQRWARH